LQAVRLQDGDNLLVGALDLRTILSQLLLEFLEVLMLSRTRYSLVRTAHHNDQGC
jgi:hypothetical protein